MAEINPTESKNTRFPGMTISAVFVVLDIRTATWKRFLTGNMNGNTHYGPTQSGFYIVPTVAGCF